MDIVHQVRHPSNKLAAWMVAAPFPHIDRYLLAIRWAAIMGVSVIVLGRQSGSVSDEFYGEMPVSPLAILALVYGYNLLLSFLIWRKRPLAQGRVGWLLIGDLLQAILLTGLSGGLNSIYFILFPVTMVEVGLTFKVKAAVVLSVAIAALHFLVVSAGLSTGWDSLTVAILAARSFVILTLGALLTLFSEEMRRAETAQQSAAQAASQAAILNEIFLRLGEDSLEPERILSTILDGAQVLPAVSFCLVVLAEPDSKPRRWRVAASTSNRHTTDSDASA